MFVACFVTDVSSWQFLLLASMQCFSFFFFFGKNMTFGYWFSPCGARLVTGWNKLEIQLAIRFFLKVRFWRKIKWKWSSIRWLIFFQSGYFWLYRCQIVVGFLALANSKKERFKQLCNELCRFQSPIPISIGSNFNNQPNGQQ